MEENNKTDEVIVNADASVNVNTDANVGNTDNVDNKPEAKEEYSDEDNFEATAISLRKADPVNVKYIAKCAINNASVSELEGEFGTYRRIVLTLNKKVPGIVNTHQIIDGEEQYVIGLTNQIFVMESQILAVVGQCAHPLVKRYAKTMKSLSNDALAKALIGKLIDVCLLHVYPADPVTGEVTEFVNPFSRNAKGREVQYESFYANVVKVHPTKELINDAAIDKAVESNVTITLQDILSLYK